MKHYKPIIISFFAIVILGVPWLITYYPKSTRFVDGIFGYINSHIGAAFFIPTITVAQLQDKYDESLKKRNDKVHIMIVPGHEPNFGGAEYKNLKERDMTVELSENLAQFLSSDPHFEVIVARDRQGWNSLLQTYFNQNWEEIKRFRESSMKEMIKLVNQGKVSTYQNGIYHNKAPDNIALRLYGINKWNNENGIDLAIHVHFNDNPRKNYSAPGKYSGLAIYIPEKQYSNSTTTNSIADHIFKRLSKYSATSDLPIENDGVIQEQELIAIGSYNTSDIPSMLIEYGYIYEPQFTNDVTRGMSLKDLAYRTYLGIQDFFENTEVQVEGFDNLILPYTWNSNITKENNNALDVLALQTALMLEDVYPPEGKTKNDCPRTGTFGNCTVKSLLKFQEKYDIKGENGYVGERTRKILNSLFSVSPK